jgi:hypothetical protein
VVVFHDVIQEEKHREGLLVFLSVMNVVHLGKNKIPGSECEQN